MNVDLEVAKRVTELKQDNGLTIIAALKQASREFSKGDTNVSIHCDNK